MICSSYFDVILTDISTLFESPTPDKFPSSYVHLIQYIIALCILQKTLAFAAAATTDNILKQNVALFLDQEIHCIQGTVALLQAPAVFCFRGPLVCIFLDERPQSQGNVLWQESFPGKHIRGVRGISSFNDTRLLS
jgi:hypothetical protein